MKDNYLKAKTNIKTINIYFFISLIPLIITGFYKNGINLYQQHLISFISMFKPLLFDLLGFIIGASVNVLYEKIFRKNKSKFFSLVFSSFHPLYGLLIASIISINTNIFLFAIISFLCLFISKFFKSANVNIVALTSLIIIFIIELIGDFSFLNTLEQNTELNLVALDYFLGKGSGGINATNGFAIIIGMLILYNGNTYYKKEIPIISIITYLSCTLIYCLINNDIGSIFNNIFSNNILFSFIFIASDTQSSCYTQKGKIIYSIIIGTISFALFLVYPPLAALGGIIIASICHKTIDRFFA